MMKRKTTLTTKIIIALILGIIVGFGLNIIGPNIFHPIDQYVLYPLGQIFIRLISMLVVPLVFVSITLGVAGLGDPKKLGRIGGKSLSFFLISTPVALAIAIGLSYLIKPGAGGNLGVQDVDYVPVESPSMMETILNIIPTNPVEAMSSGNMLQIITFAILIGLALAVLGEKTKGIYRLFEQVNDVIMYLITIIMKTAPYGAFALIASAIGKQGIDAFQAMGMFFITVIIALLAHCIFYYGSVIKFLGKMSPIKFYKGFAPAMSVAFSTSSSSATLPISMKTVEENLNVPKSISSFVMPLGATINMDGTAIMQGAAVVFIAQAYGINLSLNEILVVVIMAILASIGTAGVPGAGVIMLTMVISAVSLPVEGIGLILGIERLIDMARTTVNIIGDATCAVIVSASEKKFEESSYL